MSNKAIIAHLNTVTIKYKSNLLALLIAILIHSLWYACDMSKLLSFSYLHVSLGHIGYIALLLMPSFYVIQKSYLQKWWIFFSSLALLDLPPLMYITNNQLIDNSIFISSLNISILLFTFLIVSTISTSDYKDLLIQKKDLYIIFISSLFFAAVYHGVNYYLKEIMNISNEARSIFISGLEFHHINYGIILLVSVPILFRYIHRFTKILKLLYLLFLGFIYGTVFDESFYYMLQDVSDEAYLQIVPISISIIFIMVSFLIWIYFLSKKEIKDA